LIDSGSNCTATESPKAQEPCPSGRRGQKIWPRKFSRDLFVNAFKTTRSTRPQMSSDKKNAIGRLIALIAILIALFLAMKFLPVQEWLRSFNTWVAQMGVGGIFIFIGVYAVATVLLAPGS